MSYDLFVRSSINNFGSRHRKEIETVLDSVDNPKWHTDENLDIIIDEDFDMRHVIAIAKWLEDEE